MSKVGKLQEFIEPTLCELFTATEEFQQWEVDWLNILKFLEYT